MAKKQSVIPKIAKQAFKKALKQAYKEATKKVK